MRTVVVPYRLSERLKEFADAARFDDAVAVGNGPRAAMIEAIHAQVAARVGAAAEPLAFVAGDRVVALPAIAALQRRGIHPSAIWIGEHADLHVAASAPAGSLERMTLAILTGLAGAALRKTLRLEPMPAARAAFVSCAPDASAEDAALARAGIAVVAPPAIPVARLPQPPYVAVVDAATPGALDAWRALALRGAIPVTIFACRDADAARSLMSVLEPSSPA